METIIHNDHPARRYAIYSVIRIGDAEWHKLLVCFGIRYPKHRIVKKALKKGGLYYVRQK